MTQLFLSFRPTHFDSSTDNLQSTLNRISSWMTANLLTLNSSKTEFLLTGLSKQLAKIKNSSLTTSHSARNLGFVFDEHLAFSGQISSVSESCYYLIRQLPSIPWFKNSLHHCHCHCSIVHCKLDYWVLYHNLPKSEITRLDRSRTLLHVLLSKLPNPVTLLQYRV